MKRMKVLLVSVIIFMAGGLMKAHSQITAVWAAATDALLQETHLDQVIYYAQSIGQMVDSAIDTYNTAQNIIKMGQLAYQNLQGVVNVRDFDDFMSWYNRQLYLERQIESTFSGMGVSIGGKKYTFAEMDDMGDALKTSYVDFWKNDFSPAQRQEMWLNLGLSPGNYAYVQTWKEREKELAASALTKLQALNERYMETMRRQRENKNKLMADKLADPEGKMGEKDMLTLILEEQMDTNRAIQEATYDQAEANARAVAAERLNDVPPNPPRLSEMWGEELFSPIAEE
ncbi:MAG: hypothetical protein LBL44_12200 [Treponema sp.]|nr:hypothetical protein [Treponema sp.]